MIEILKKISYYLYKYEREKMEIFVTLTISKEIQIKLGEKVEEEMEEFRRKGFRIIKRDKDVKSFIGVSEISETNHYHYHCLLDKKIDFQGLNEKGHKITGNIGPGVHGEVIKNKNEIVNILNYMMKDVKHYGISSSLKDKVKSGNDIMNWNYEGLMYIWGKRRLSDMCELKIKIKGTKVKEEELELNMYEYSLNKLRNKSFYSGIQLVVNKKSKDFRLMINAIRKSKGDLIFEAIAKVLEKIKNESFLNKIYKGLGGSILYMYFLLGLHKIEIKKYNLCYRIGALFNKFLKTYELLRDKKIYNRLQEYYGAGGLVLKDIIEGGYLKDIFQIIEIKVDDVIRVKVVINDDYKENLIKILVKRNLYGKIPMIVSPKDGNNKESKLIKNYTGGYLGNDIFMQRALSTYYITHEIEYPTERFFNCINYLQSIEGTIDGTLFTFLKKQKDIIYKYLIYDKIDKLDEDLTNAINKLNTCKKQKESKELKEEYFYLKSARDKKLMFDKTFEVIDELVQYESLYFVVKIDFRGRVYVVSDYLNYQGNKLARSLLRFKEKKKVDSKGLQIYIASLYFGTINESGNTLLHKFGCILKDLTFEQIGLSKKGLYAKEPLLFLSAFLEYERYRYYGEGYESGFVIGLDASCSGSQLISLLFNVDEYKESLNLKATNMDTPIGDYYLHMVNKFKEVYGKDKWFQQSFKDLKDNQGRDLMKKVIMTLSYGLTLEGILYKLKDGLRVLKLYKTDKELKELSDKFYHFMEDNILFKNMELFRDLVHLLSARKPDVSGSSGIHGMMPRRQRYVDVIINQKYLERERQRIYFLKGDKKNIYKRKGITLMNYKIDKPNKKKREVAIKANLIHHMDAIWVLSTVDKYKELKGSIGIIHDCFGTHLSDVDNLNKALKSALRQLFRDKEQVGRFIRSLVVEVADSNTEDYKTLMERINLSKNLYYSKDTDLLKDLDKAIYLVWPK